jgi:uncharacterized protein YecE (DUF72 family)
MGDIRVGTSGYHYKHWLGTFYPKGLPPQQMLAYYMRHFDTVEINNSFYRLPAVEAFENWRDSTTDDFRFAVKASRYITHMKKLKDPESGLKNFLPRAEALGEKLGPVVFQLPPRWRCDLGRLADFLRSLPAGHRYSFELRDTSWHNPAVYELLSRHNAAFCIYELAGFQSPIEVTADFSYVRLHGPKEKAYQGSYSRPALMKWASRMREWRGELKAAYLYFDNDEAGHAAKNAMEIKSLL